MNIEKMTTMMQQSLAQAQEIAQNRKHHSGEIPNELGDSWFSPK